MEPHCIGGGGVWWGLIVLEGEGCDWVSLYWRGRGVMGPHLLEGEGCDGASFIGGGGV